MKIYIDFEKKVGNIKKMHGVGQPPVDEINYNLFKYLKEAGIPYSRLHDVGGGFGGNMYVDIHNLFRDFSADESLEESYDFAFTDMLIKALVDNNCEPIFRLGETIENYHFIKAYRIFPPKDYEKWARICEHIIKHYNEGWANGFHYNITYWEIWNEPDNGRDNTENQMWHGTAEDYYRLYAVTAKHLKSVFGDKIKVGGPATCGFRHIFSNPEKYGINCEKSDDEVYASGRSENFLNFIDGFFRYIKKENAPIDFFSWHSYLSVDKTVIASEFLDRKLKEYGYFGIETQLNEWNNVCEDRSDPLMIHSAAKAENGTGKAAAKACAMMCAMQNTNTDILCYYDSGINIWDYAGMFDCKKREPYPLYYAFVAFGELYRIGDQVEVTGVEDGIYTLAAGRDGKKALLLANTNDESVNVSTNIKEPFETLLIDDDKKLEKTEINSSDFILPGNSIILLRN